jgi:hypothetical protein
MNKKTSEDWNKECVAEVLGPDGWDRKNFQYSWFVEKITKDEFERRFIRSTIKVTCVHGSIPSTIWKE